jgi:hypothetical protein
MSSNVPEARKRLSELFSDPETPIAVREKLMEIMPLLHRTRTKAVTAAREARPMTPKLAEAVRRAAAQYPNASVQTLAIKFDTNPGRISEALAYIH